jgi:hypothetical protein
MGHVVHRGRNFAAVAALKRRKPIWRTIMGFGRGLLLWLLGIPLPIIILLAIFWR